MPIFDYISTTGPNSGTVQLTTDVVDVAAATTEVGVGNFDANYGFALAQNPDAVSPQGPVGAVDASMVRQDGSGQTGILASATNQQMVNDILDINAGEVSRDISVLQNTAFNSGRSFRRFNDGFTIDRTNLAQFEDVNHIYTAKNDKPTTSETRPDVILPNDAEIAASGEPYPITFEFTHLGGSVPSTPTLNVVRFFLDGVMISTLNREQIAIVTKPAAGQPYDFVGSQFDAGDTILPGGVFNIKEETPVNNIVTIATELSGVTIVAGDAYIIETGGTWSGYTIGDHSVLVATVDSASLVDSPSNNDWVLINNDRARATAAALLANFQQNGVRFTANRNILIDPFNVAEFNASATGAPVTLQFGTNTQTFPTRDLVFANQPIQFPDLTGGQLTISLSFFTTRVSGFPAIPNSFTLDYGAHSFTFPLNGVDFNTLNAVVTIDIPAADYSSILNTNATTRLNYSFSGALHTGSYVINSVVNTFKGPLNDTVRFIAQSEDVTVRSALEGQIAALRGNVDQESSSLAAISDRISPYRTNIQQTPYPNARFLNSTGSDAFPSDVGAMQQVSASNPVFAITGTALFVAVPADGQTYVLQNNTNPMQVELSSIGAQGNPNLDLGESLQFQGQTYFVFRLKDATISDAFEVLTVIGERVVAWQDDIDSLKNSDDFIRAQLSHAVLNLPEAVTNILEHATSVTSQTTQTEIASAYNKSLGLGGTQKIFREAAPKTPSGGTLDSSSISATSGARARRKLLYIEQGATYTNGPLLTATDGVTQTTIVEYLNGVLNARVFAPAAPAGSATSTVYPAPSNRVSGQGIWQTIPALTFVNGIPTEEADELFFERNNPSTSATLTIQYRGHANGNVFGTGSTTLAGVGGGSDVLTSFVLDDGGEAATVEVLWRAATRDIRVSVTERVRTGLPTINDIEVILSYTETRTVPATPETTRIVALEQQVPTGVSNVIAVKPSSVGNLILVSNNVEVDTNYPFTTLFGGAENGHLIVSTENAVFLDYENIEPVADTVRDLENHSTLPTLGLFTINYSTQSTLVLSVSIQAESFVHRSPDTSLWDVTIDDLGNFVRAKRT